MYTLNKTVALSLFSFSLLAPFSAHRAEAAPNPFLEDYTGGVSQTIFASVNHIDAHLEREMKKMRSHLHPQTKSPSPLSRSYHPPSLSYQEEWDTAYEDEENTALPFSEYSSSLLCDADEVPSRLPRDENPSEAQQEHSINLKEEGSWNFYLGPLGSLGDVVNKPQQIGFNYWSAGALVGFDYSFDEVGMGILANYERIEANVHQQWGKFDIDQAHASAYATYAPIALGAFSMDGVIGAGYQWYDFYRNTEEGEVAKGTPKGWEFDALIAFEYTFENWQFAHIPPHLQLIPVVSLQYIHLDIDQYKESGANFFDLSMQKQKAESLRSTLGAAVNYTWIWKNLSFCPEVNVGWQREYLDHHRAIAFTPLNVTGPSSSIGITGAGRNTALIGANLLFEFFEQFNVEASYDFEWNSLFHDHFFYLGFNSSF